MGQLPSRRPDIQGLRAMAVLLVVIFHAGLPLPGGFIGVDVFFVISGYVITGMLMRERAAHGRIDFGRFYRRRVRRLLPALALVVVVTLLLSVALLSPLGPLQQTSQTGVGALLALANVVIARNTGGYFQPAAERNALLNTWSLSVEEQFYLVFPALIAFSWFAARRVRTRWRVDAMATGFLGVGSLGLALMATTDVGQSVLPDPFLGFYSPFLRAWEFAVGALAMLMVGSRTTRRLPGATPLALVAGIAVLASGLLFTPLTPWPGLATLVPVVATAALLVAGQVPGNPVSRVLEAPWLTWIGDRSYSWYLWHWPLIVLAIAAFPDVPAIALLAAAISLPVAALAYRCVEDPIRHRVATTGAQRLTFVGLALVLPLTASVVVTVGVQRGLANPDVNRLLEASRSDYVATLAGCDDPGGERTEPSPSCTWGIERGGTPIYLVGDSQALQYSDGLVDAADRLDRPLIAMTATGCPFTRVALARSDRSTEWGADCLRYVDRTVQWLASAPPGDVVVANSDQYWTDELYALGPLWSADAARSEIKETALSPQQTGTLGELRRAGHEVTLVLPIPRFTGPGHSWDPYSCRVLTVLAGACRASAPSDALLDAQGSSREQLVHLAVAEGARPVDLTPLICPSGVCDTERFGEPVYANAGHVSTAMSRQIGATFERLLRLPDSPSALRSRPVS